MWTAEIGGQRLSNYEMIWLTCFKVIDVGHSCSIVLLHPDWVSLKKGGPAVQMQPYHSELQGVDGEVDFLW